MTLWEKQAKRWNYIGAPLRPDVLDIQNNTLWIKQLAQKLGRSLTVLLLGTTPEIVNITWPKGTTLLSLDNSLSMLTAVLPKQTPQVKPVPIWGDWLNLPIRDAHIDLVIGDGCISVLGQEHYAELLKEIKRVLHPQGAFIIRFFMRPALNEPLKLIQQDFLEGKITNFNILKWRIAMALHGSLNQGVCLKDVWDFWQNHIKAPDEAMLKTLQWSQEVMDTINNYYESTVHYTFPNLEEIKSIFNSHFLEHEHYFPDYPLGERCPSFFFTPRK